jgi:hypothetical protein
MSVQTRFRLALAIVALLGLLSFGCATTGEVSHGDYGYCQRSVRHKHNDHVFLGDYHDHSLCEWEKFN